MPASVNPGSIVAHREVADLERRGVVDLLHFHNGMVLMVSQEAVGLYRDRAAVSDPLGNGALGYQPIPADLQDPPGASDGHVHEVASGFVGLRSGAVLFIRPDGVALYPDNHSALHNQSMQWIIPFPVSGG